VVPTVLLLMELLEPRLLRLRTLTKLILVGVLMVGVLFAYSRAAWLNLGVAITVLLVVLPLRRGGGRRAVALVIAAVLGLAAVGVAVSITGSADFLAERAQGQTYDSQRFGAQELGLRIAGSNPVGIGPGQFEEVAPISAHSTYIRALAEEGVLGFVLLTALLFGTLLLAIRNVVAGSGTFGISAAALLAVWCGMLANSLFVDTLHWRHLWIVAGLIWAGALLPGPGQASSSAGVRTPT
jgi:O-antigen ligase